ncbi:hypothetical protein B0H10DRAFT_2176376 [Mycena sp. CBHHK59/15]|nr:hypothetical protein B0H10DRAFT_2176376 [Mycena sp. CBHHK59/15]
MTKLIQRTIKEANSTVALLLQGRQAGKKTKGRPYLHAVVAGIEWYPRNKVKPSIKVRDQLLCIRTRYALELEGLKGSVAADTFKEPTQPEDAKKTIKTLLDYRYTAGKNRLFFMPRAGLNDSLPVE